MGLNDILTNGQPSLAILIDPEKVNLPSLPILLEIIAAGNGDLILIGGSTSVQLDVDLLITKIKAICPQPVVLFPGHSNQLSRHADYLLLPSIISGHSFQYLIGEHILNARKIKNLNIPVFSTGYILMKDDTVSSALALTESEPIDPMDIEQIVDIAIAAEMIGINSIYLEAGSGAKQMVSNPLILNLKKAVSIPIIVGGGINSMVKIDQILLSNPNLIVIGNILESKPELLEDLYSRVCINRSEEILKASKSAG